MFKNHKEVRLRLYDGSLVISSKAIMYSNYCIKCKNKEYASYIYKGNSLCEKHFKLANKQIRKFIEKGG